MQTPTGRAEPRLFPSHAFVRRKPIDEVRYADL